MRPGVNPPPTAGAAGLLAVSQGDVTRGVTLGLWLELGLARGRAGLGWGLLRLTSVSRIPLIPMDRGGRFFVEGVAGVSDLGVLLIRASAEKGDAFTG